jgi:hypothetical protein
VRREESVDFSALVIGAAEVTAGHGWPPP